MPTILEQLQYGFDRDSRRTWRQRATTQGWDNAYVYDSLSQVIGDDRGNLNLAQNAIAGIPAGGARWQYDETGNWHGYQTLADGTATLTQARTHDKGNRLMEVSDAAAMRTDRAGRMTEVPYAREDGDWSTRVLLLWDAWGRLARAWHVGGPPDFFSPYQYDGLHRRITNPGAAGQTLHSYYNDEWRPVEQREESESTATASYLWGSRHRDDLVRRDRAVGGTTLNEVRYVLMDYFSPVAITNESGDVTERYQFSTFGLRTILNPDFTVRSDSECGMEFSFQGQFEDVETGWMNYGYRYYLPALGRWSCKDPIKEAGGNNLYLISDNDAINYVDHLGLFNFDEGENEPCMRCCWRQVVMTHYGDLPSDKVGTRNNKLKPGDVAVGHTGSSQMTKTGDMPVLPFGSGMTVYPNDGTPFEGSVADVGAFDKKHPDKAPTPDSWIDIWDPEKSKKQETTRGWVRIILGRWEKICPGSYFEAPCSSQPDGDRLWPPDPNFDPDIGPDKPGPSPTAEGIWI